jgi:hypothetical protein
MAPETLNVTLPHKYSVCPDTTIEPDKCSTGETVKLQRCRVHESPGRDGADVLELIISPLHLRTAWELQESEELEIEVEGAESWGEWPAPPD